MTNLTPAGTELREAMMALARQMRRHRPDTGLTRSQLELLAEVIRYEVITPAELAARLQVRVQSLTDSINDLDSRGLLTRTPDPGDRRRQLLEATELGTQVMADDRAERDAWLQATMRETLTQLEFDLLLLVAPILRKLAEAESGHGSGRGERSDGTDS